MKSIASAPGKIILFGEHFVVYGLKAILCTIDKRITATSYIIDQKVMRIKSSLGEYELKFDDGVELSPRLVRPFFHIVKEVMKENTVDKGIEVIIKSDIPTGVGLGSSSASCVAVTASTNGLFKKLSKMEIWKKALEAERTIFEQNSGADSSVSTFGGIMTYDFKNGFKNLDSRNNLNFIISNSAQIHNTDEVVKGVREFKKRNEENFEKLCLYEEDITRKAITSINENNLVNAGKLMLENHELLKQIGVSTRKLDDIVNESIKHSFGAKMTGAGGGGCVISLVDKSNINQTFDSLKNISDCFMVKIDYDGLLIH